MIKNDKYIDECKTIAQNCVYTAETHHIMADVHRKQSIWFQVIPAAIAALSSAAVTLGATAEWVPVLTLISSITAAVSTVLNPSKQYEEHLSAAKAFTSLKHDARFLSEAESLTTSEDTFIERVRTLHNRYNSLIEIVPATSSKYFGMAHKRVQAGVHEPDRKNGKIV